MNVWKPKHANSTSNLPVYLWIYGGRFEGGGCDVLTYDVAGLAAKDVIVITINYRLGLFGFLAHPEPSAKSRLDSPGNYGLLDQIAAIAWAKDEIHVFGADPSHITVGDQSAGLASSLDIVYSPLSNIWLPA